MAAGFKSLRDDDVGAVCFERTRLGHRRRRAEDDAAGFLHSPNCGCVGQAKVKADDPRPQLENEVEPFFVEGWKRLCGLRDRSQPKFVEIGCEPRSHAGRRVGVEPRVRMDEKIQIVGTVCRLAQCGDLVSHRRRRNTGAADRSQAARVAHRRGERGRRETGHRRLNDRVSYAEQFEEIRAWPHRSHLQSSFDAGSLSHQASRQQSAIRVFPGRVCSLVHARTYPPF